jgi:lipid-binding SYLF domain-containing protein
MEGFVGDKVTLGGDFAVSAGPVGRNTSASTDGKLQASIYSYSMSKGLFAGLSLEGAYVDVDENANKAYWNKTVSARETLKKRADDKRVLPLTRKLDSLIKTAK